MRVSAEGHRSMAGRHYTRHGLFFCSFTSRFVQLSYAMTLDLESLFYLMVCILAKNTRLKKTVDCMEAVAHLEYLLTNAESVHG